MQNIIWESGELYLNHAIKVWAAGASCDGEVLPYELKNVIEAYLDEVPKEHIDVEHYMGKFINEAKRRLQFKNIYLQQEDKIDAVTPTLKNKTLIYSVSIFNTCFDQTIEINLQKFKENLWHVFISANEDIDTNDLLDDHWFLHVLKNTRETLGHPGRQLKFPY